MYNPNYYGPSVSEQTISQGHLRLLFRYYVIAATTLIVVLGTQCLKQYVRRRLLRGQSVQLSATTGWSSGPALAAMFWKLRALPGGWLGFLMVVTSLTNLATDTGVSVGINQIYGNGTAYYNSGMIVSATGNFTQVPDPVEAAAATALQAQYNSWSNANRTLLAGQHYAIYDFVPTDVNFMAQDTDIIGYWTCHQTTSQAGLLYGSTFQGNATEIYDQAIWDDLVQKGLMYEAGASNNVSYSYTDGTSYGPSTHLYIMSSNWTAIGDFFNVNFAIGVSDLTEGAKLVRTWNCNLRSTDAAKTTWVTARHMNMFKTIFNWTPTIQGAMWPGLYTYAAYDERTIQVQTEWYLNAMVMVSGAHETINAPNPNLTYGVVQFKTIIPYWVIVMCIVTTLWAIAFAIMMVILMLTNKRLAHKYDRDNSRQPRVSSKEIVENTPTGLLDWMCHAAYESRDVDDFPEGKNLKNWIVSSTWHGQRRLGIVKKSDDGQVGPGKSHASYSPPGTNSGYPTGKTEYTAVNTSEMR